MADATSYRTAADRAPPVAPDRAELARTLRLRDLVLLVPAVVIGSGIFIVPSTVMRQTVDIGPMLLVWLAAGVLSVLGALTYGELGAMKPEAGGLYVYVRDAFGRFAAFLLGWTFLLVISTGALATLAVAFTAYVDRLVPLSATAERLVPVGMIALLAAINIRGVRESVAVGNVGTAIKAGAILIMSAAFLAAGDGFASSSDRLWPQHLSLGLLSGVGVAMIGVLWAYEGWQYVTFSAGETKNPARNFPLGIGIGTALIVAIYLVANIGYLAVLGPDGVASSQAVAADAARRAFGAIAEKLIALAITVSMFSAANAVVLTAPRIYYRMGRDGVFFRGLGEVSPRFRTPITAIGVSAVWAMILAATGTFEQLLTYVVFAGWIFYALGAASVFVLRRRQPDAPRPFRVPGYPVTPLLFVAASLAIVVNTLFAQPVQALLGLGIVLLGTPVYLIWRSR